VLDAESEERRFAPAARARMSRQPSPVLVEPDRRDHRPGIIAGDRWSGLQRLLQVLGLDEHVGVPQEYGLELVVIEVRQDDMGMAELGVGGVGFVDHPGATRHHGAHDRHVERAQPEEVQQRVGGHDGEDGLLRHQVLEVHGQLALIRGVGPEGADLRALDLFVEAALEILDATEDAAREDLIARRKRRRHAAASQRLRVKVPGEDSGQVLDTLRRRAGEERVAAQDQHLEALPGTDKGMHLVRPTGGLPDQLHAPADVGADRRVSIGWAETVPQHGQTRLRALPRFPRDGRGTVGVPAGRQIGQVLDRVEDRIPHTLSVALQRGGVKEF